MSYRSVFAKQSMQNRTIIVTGGGSGIGRCCAHELASLGAKVILIGRNLDKLLTVQQEIHEDGGQADYAQLDIRIEADVDNTVAALVERHGPIYGLVNNAGGQFPSPLEQISQRGFEAVVNTNLTGGFLMSKALFSHSMSDHGGVIVNITADYWGGMPGMGHSGAARAGMENFTKTAAWEWGHKGVRVNAVAPGWVASSGMDTYEEPMRSKIPKMREDIPLKRMATESEVSSAIVFLLSEGASFISGTTIRVDGAASQGSAVWPIRGQKASNSVSYQGFHRAVVPNVLQQES